MSRQVGDYVLFGTYIIQLYTPLNWFGTYYRCDCRQQILICTNRKAATTTASIISHAHWHDCPSSFGSAGWSRVRLLTWRTCWHCCQSRKRWVTCARFCTNKIFSPTLLYLCHFSYFEGCLLQQEPKFFRTMGKMRMTPHIHNKSFVTNFCFWWTSTKVIF